jgi:SAM-dependent methyltransferase
MSDFRRELYASYVSEFKRVEPATTAREREGYWAWCDRRYLPLLERVPRDQAVLELGCGPGQLLEYLGQRGFTRRVGIDLSEEQIRRAHARRQPALVADALPFLRTQPDRFGLIVAVDVFEHFTRDELIPLAQAIHGALRPGGVLLVQTANGQGLFPNQVIYGDLTHVTIFTPGSLGHLLRRSGFDQLAFAETGPVPVRLRGRLDSTAWWAIRALASFIRQVETGKRQTVWTENFLCRAVRAPAPDSNQH